MNTQDKIKMDVNWRIKKMDKKCGILIVSVTILVLCFVGTASAGTWYVDDDGGADFTGIQAAINNAKDGDTIIVHSGVYYENVVVDKLVTLRGIGHPVVDASGSDSAITLTADGITLVGFTATNSGSSEIAAGIMVTSNDNTITGNKVSNNNYDGIFLWDSSNNTITDNKVSNNNDGGIFLWDSSNNNTISGNKVSNNNYGGIFPWDSSNNTITGNNVSNNNEEGISLFLSRNNKITGNNVSNNWEGIALSSSSNNKIYFNNFINNTDNVYSYASTSASTNIWNSPLEITYTYDETTYESYVGNYWDDYEGTDAEGDGIGDTHYSIDSEKDESDDYPLMKPFENYIIPSSAHTQTPGFELLFAIIGVVAAIYLIKRKV